MMERKDSRDIDRIQAWYASRRRVGQEPPYPPEKMFWERYRDELRDMLRVPANVLGGIGIYKRTKAEIAVEASTWRWTGCGVPSESFAMLAVRDFERERREERRMAVQAWWKAQGVEVA